MKLIGRGKRIQIGVSSCLLGERVRYNGGHKRDAFVSDILGPFVDYIPVCPEVEFGLGVPREAIRLEKTSQGIRLKSINSQKDLTASMTSFVKSRVNSLQRREISGYILKENSPSCGMRSVKVYEKRKSPTKNGVGIFAKILLERNPLLPVEEEGRLNNVVLRENFLERVFAYDRLKRFFSKKRNFKEIYDFHATKKYLLLAHNPGSYRKLERLMEKAQGFSGSGFEKAYPEFFMSCLTKIGTHAKHFNVLRQLLGYFRNLLDVSTRKELHSIILDYRKGYVPLIVPLTLLSHYVRLYKIGCLSKQTYLNPHPQELMLKNYVLGHI